MLKSKQKITGQTGNDGTKYFQIMVPLKYLSKFWRTLEMPSMNCGINVLFNLVCRMYYSNWNCWQSRTKKTDPKLYVSVVILSAQGNTKLLQQLKAGFKKIINWNKYQSKPILQTKNRYLNYLNDPSVQEVNRHHLKMMHIIEVTIDIFLRL